MKIFASHDADGRIRGVTIPADEHKGGELSVDPEPGQHVSVVDVDSVADDKLQAFVTDLVRHYRVERSAKAPARFVKKQS
jgi:hypothetical protein